jgi:hypothetical protein
MPKESAGGRTTVVALDSEGKAGIITPTADASLYRQCCALPSLPRPGG